MSDREQLLELREAIDGMSANYRDRLGFCPLELIDRLLARFPYAEGEEIYVGNTERQCKEDPIHVDFVFQLPGMPGVYASAGDETPAVEYWEFHRPVPKCKTLKVPGHIIDTAKRVVEASESAASVSDADKFTVFQWLAREAGKDG